MRKLQSILATTVLGTLLASHSSEACNAVALRDVSTREKPGAILKKGRKHHGITQYSVLRKTQEAWFCSHGGVCNPAVGLKLLNCKVSKSKVFEDPDETAFYVIER